MEIERINLKALVASFMMGLSCLLAFNTGPAQAADAIQTLTWDELIPEELRALQVPTDTQMIDHSGAGPLPDALPAFDESTLRKDLQGKKIRLPGFIVPLDGNETHVTEFLLVPYFGACIHVPPPPANQIVHIYFPEGIEHDLLYDAIWIEGVMSAGLVESELAVSGYSLQADRAELYDYENPQY